MSAVTKEYEEVGDISTGASSTSVKWKIYEFFSLPQEVDYWINSPCFQFLDGIWHLKMCPNGESDWDSEGYIGLYLMPKIPDSSKQLLRVSFRILTKDGIELTSVCTGWVFPKGDREWGKPFFLARSEVEKRKAEFNPAIVSCDICTTMTLTTETASQTDPRKDMDKLAENFMELFLSGEDSDLTLSVRGREFKCHRTVLAARSSVFAAMLRQDMLERATGVVQIDDCEPEAFREFLIYIYSGSLANFTLENALRLYRIADKYDAPEVKKKCVDLMDTALCVNNFCDVLQLSLQHGESELLQKAVSFYAKNT